MESQCLSQQQVPDAATNSIGFVGDRGVGKTAVATLVADRLADRTQVTVVGEAGRIVDGASGQRSHGGRGLAIAWRVVDAKPGPDSLEQWADTLDTVFVVATPNTLGNVSAYQRIVNRDDTTLFLIATRYTETDREQIRAFDGPTFAEYFYEDGEIKTAIDADEVPTLDDRTVEAILIEALQPKRLTPAAAIDALEARQASIVNMEVSDRMRADVLINRFERAGYRAAYYQCNCRCHDGHVIARVLDEG